MHGILYSKENERFRRSGFFQMSELPQRTIEQPNNKDKRKAQILEEVKESQYEDREQKRKTRNS